MRWEDIRRHRHMVPIEVSTDEVGSGEISPGEVGSAEVCTAKVCTTAEISPGLSLKQVGTQQFRRVLLVKFGMLLLEPSQGS